MTLDSSNVSSSVFGIIVAFPLIGSDKAEVAVNNLYIATNRLPLLFGFTSIAVGFC